MLARVPWRPVQTDKPKPKRLSGDRRRQLVSNVVDILEQGEPTRFAYEADCRHAVRAKLCLKGWSWKEADEAACDIVATALRRLGVTRPTWKAGQPEYTQDGHSPIERTRCKRCHRQLPDGHYKWCSNLCVQAEKVRQLRIQEGSEDTVYKIIVGDAKWWRG
ncbi:MAG: hypothetical protein ACQETX_08345 [Pseudomonadota bacterium]